MWHTAVYSASVANSLTNAALNAVTETVLRTGPTGGFLLFSPATLLSAWSVRNNGTAFRLTSPKYQPFGPIECMPVGTATSLTDGELVASWPFRAPTFRAQEEMTATVDTGGSAAAQETLAVSLGFSYDNIPNGEELTLKFTSTTAAAAYTWTLLTLVEAVTIPVGVYALLASEHFSASGIAHRWNFDGQSYRPGFPSVNARTDHQWPGVRDYRQGMAGQFSNLVLPQVEVFCETTDSAHVVFARAIKVA